MSRPKTIATPAALRRDTRFQACSPGAKWVYGHLCDRAEVVAEPGMDVLGTVVLIVDGLGDTPRGVLAPILEELAGRGLVTMEATRLVVHEAEEARERKGPRGGLSGAERTARWRADRAARAQAVTANPSRGDVTVTDSPSRDPSQTAQRDGQPVTESVTVTVQSVTRDPSHTADCDGMATAKPSHIAGRDGQSVTQPVTVTESVTDSARVGGSGGSAPSFPGFSPLTLPPLTPHPSPPPTDVPPSTRAREALTLTAPTPGAGRGDAPEPPQGSLAARTLAALRATTVLRAIAPKPVTLAVALSSGAYPALDLPAEVARAEAWLVANPSNAKKNGARFLVGWCQRAQERAPRLAAVTAMPNRYGASQPQRRRLGPAPAATAEEHAASMLEEDPLIAMVM